MTIFLIDATAYEIKRKSIKNVDILTTTETNLGIKVFLHNELLIMFIKCLINPNIDSKLQHRPVQTNKANESIHFMKFHW